MYRLIVDVTRIVFVFFVCSLRLVVIREICYDSYYFHKKAGKITSLDYIRAHVEQAHIFLTN